MRQYRLGLLAAALLPGCLAPRAAPPVPIARPQFILPELSDTCGYGNLLALIGQDFTALASAVLPGDLRIVRAGAKVDGYISPSRLNAQLDSNGVIRDLFCG